MVTVLTNEHYTTINNFSRKISKGVNSDDLSQHVILKLLQKNNKFIAHLIKENDFNRYIWQFVKLMYRQDHSTFNREEYGTHHVENRPKFINLDGLMFYHKVISDRDDVDIGNLLQRINLLKEFDSVFSLEENKDNIDLGLIIKNAQLTDKERMYLNSYIDSGCSYKQCSRDLDIHQQTISKYVKQALDKCRNSL